MFYVSISATAIEKIKEHANKNLDKEVIGLLIGRMEGNTLIIEDSVTGEIVSERTWALIVPETIAKIADEIVSGKIKGSVVGWYHSHPGFGVFMSEIDIKTQMKMQQFSPYIVALIIDPTKDEMGLFTLDMNTRMPVTLTEDFIHIYAPGEEPVPPKFMQPPPPQFFYSPSYPSIIEKPPVKKGEKTFNRRLLYLAATLIPLLCVAIFGIYVIKQETQLKAEISPVPNNLFYGNKILLSANVSGGKPPYNFTWYVNGKPICSENRTHETQAYFNYTPKTEDLGNITIKFEVTDTNLRSFSKNISLIVYPNAYVQLMKPEPGESPYPNGTLRVEGIIFGFQNYRLVMLNSSLKLNFIINYLNTTKNPEVRAENIKAKNGLFNCDWKTPNEPANVTIRVIFNGSESFSRCEDYRTIKINTPPKACFSWNPKTPSVNQTVTFNASCSVDLFGRIVSYQWDFNNDSIYDANGTIVYYSFKNYGNHIVKMKATDEYGLSNIITQEVKVNALPVARIWASTTKGLTPLTVSFDASESYDPDGGNLTYYWNFGDGQTATGIRVNHTFSLPKDAKEERYNVTLNVIDDEETRNETKIIIDVYRISGYASFTWNPKYPYVNETVTFDASASRPSTGANINEYIWTIDGEETVQTYWILTKIFLKAQNYSVSLRITDTSGLTNDPCSKIVTVIEKPKADFEIEGELIVNGTLTFKFNGSGRIKNYFWNFSDGTVVEGKDIVTNSYDKPGTYKVTLIVTDIRESKDQMIKEITIHLKGEEKS
ncbi:MAG: PKD domain-containing protein [Candidatus Bathyarchaeia archaeon]